MKTSVTNGRLILEERARRLARPRDDMAGVETLGVLEFRVGRERFGLEADQVAGIMRLEHYTPIPGAQFHVAGIASWRGELITLVDLERLLGVDRTGLDDRAWAIAVELHGARLGLIASEVRGVSDIPESALDRTVDGSADIVLARGPEALVILNPNALIEARQAGGVT